MQYTLNDLHDDVIIVVPAQSEGISPKVAIVFQANDDEGVEEVVMVLDDRLADDLLTAIRLALKESERKG
jgi:hypothetical protein